MFSVSLIGPYYNLDNLDKCKPVRLLLGQSSSLTTNQESLVDQPCKQSSQLSDIDPTGQTQGSDHQLL